MKPTSGDVLVEGKSIVELSERKLSDIRKKIGILFQSGALFDSMSVENNIAFPLLELGVLRLGFFQDGMSGSASERKPRLDTVVFGPLHTLVLDHSISKNHFLCFSEVRGGSPNSRPAPM